MAKYIVVKFTAASVSGKVTWASLQHGGRVLREQKLKLPSFFSPRPRTDLLLLFIDQSKSQGEPKTRVGKTDSTSRWLWAGLGRVTKNLWPSSIYHSIYI